MKLRPVTYNLDMDAIARFSSKPSEESRLTEGERLKGQEVQSGFIAQEVEASANEVGYDFHGVDKPQNAESHYGLRYAEFVVPMVKAMQEQQEQIEELAESKIDLEKQEIIIQQQKEIEDLKVESESQNSKIENQAKIIEAMMERLEALENR